MAGSAEGRQLGGYRLLSQLAIGGMAEIYVAKTAGVGGFEKLVALKVIHPNYSADPDFVQMLVDEAKLAVQLQHANIVQTFDLGRVDGQYYIAMELIDGVDLYKLLRTASEHDRDFPFEVAAFIAAETASGLDYAHQKRDAKGRPLEIVHRDVSPQNILVSFEGEVKIVDFGIAKASLRTRQTAVGVIKGKYYYMSPEQAWGDPVDARSDVFSTGILLYEMIAGQMLYLEENFDLLLDKVRKADIPPPSTKRAGVPRELEAIVMTALAKRAADRYQSAAELGAALGRFLHGYAPDFNRARLAAFVQQVMGDGPRAPRQEPRKRAALTREMLLRDENSLLFKLDDLAPSHDDAPPRPPPGSPRRDKNQATSPVVSLPDLKRHLSAHSDFEENEQTIVDTGAAPQYRTDSGLLDTRPPLADDPSTDQRISPQPKGHADETVLGHRTEGAPRRHKDVPTTTQPAHGAAPLPGVKAALPLLHAATAGNAADDERTRRRPLPGDEAAARGLLSLPLGDDSGPTPLFELPHPVPIDSQPTPVLTPHLSTFEEPTRIPQPPELPPWPAGAVEPTATPTAPFAGEPAAADGSSTGVLPKQGRALVVSAIAAVVLAAGLLIGFFVPGDAPGKATIEIVSSPPGAEVRLDGVLLPQRTPLVIPDVDARAAHNVRVSLENHDPWESDVRFEQGTRQLRLQAVLQPTFGTLVLTSTPAGAEAIVNGRIRGTTPVTVSDVLPNEEVSIELRLRGYKAAHKKASFGESRELSVSIPLEKAR